MPSSRICRRRCASRCPASRGPSAYHRLTFRYQQKGRLVVVANRLSISGLAALAMGMTCAIMLVTNVLFGAVATTVITTTLTLAMFAVLWGLLPLLRRSIRG